MTASVVSEAERRAVKTFLRNLLERSNFAARWELARAAGVSESSLNEWMSEKGSLPSALNLLRLMQAVGAIDHLFKTAIPVGRTTR